MEWHGTPQQLANDMKRMGRAERAEPDSQCDPACKNWCVRPTQTHGIQTMHEAQREVTKVVQQASQDHVQECKGEQAEMSKEVEDYEKQKEWEYKASESKHAGPTQNSQSLVDRDMEMKPSATWECWNEMHRTRSRDQQVSG